MITLPKEPVPAIPDLTGNNILFTGDYGIGKSGLLASTDYLLADPEDKLKSYPCRRVVLTNWQDHLEFPKLVAKESPGTFKGIGLDSLNISYDHCLTWVMNTVRFNGVKLTHPSENPQTAYPRVTYEFINWLRSITYLGYHVIATCHVNVSEVRGRDGSSYNRWIPAFTGGSATSTYANVLKVFSIVGFMTMEDVAKPSVKQVMGKAVVDLRADSTRINTEEKRVIHFDQSPNWLANNKFSGFPDKVVLTEDWKEDWDILVRSWGHGSGEVVEEAVETTGQQVAK